MPLLWHTDNTVIGKRKVKPITAKYFTQYLNRYRQLSRRMQIPDNLWRVQDVGFWADERHAAILAVHQQLSTEMFAQQVTSGFVIDSTVDAWYDPDSIAALQILHQCRHRLSLAAASSSKTTTITISISTAISKRYRHGAGNINDSTGYRTQIYYIKSQTWQWLIWTSPNRMYTSLCSVTSLGCKHGTGHICCWVPSKVK